MPSQKNTPANQSVFSVNPETGQQFITVERAQKLCEQYIAINFSNVLEIKEMEDLIQDTMVKLVFSEYNPSKSAATTFVCICSKTTVLHSFDYHFNKGRNTVVSDFAYVNPEGEAVYHSDTLLEEVTPEHMTYMKELIELEYIPEKLEPKVPWAKRISVKNWHTKNKGKSLEYSRKYRKRKKLQAEKTETCADKGVDGL